MQRHPSFPDHASSLDAQRIAGNTLALALHAVALAILLMPSGWTPPARPMREPLVVMPDVVKPEPLRPMPPPDPRPERARTPTPVATPTATAIPIADPLPVLDAGTQAADPVAEGTPAETYTPGPPALATLAYRVYPAPRYPRAALRAGKTGTVTLKVLVDEQGWPRQVAVDTSSGHRELDRAAREHVQATWRFHPAMQRGRAVSAYALVPIEFTLP
ncbi:MAG: energy transducer TonB [Arenimonas sp.]|nr:energy transducer TonB [Arenimonas sp.]